MNLLFINQALSFGGAEVFNIDLLTALQKEKDFRVTAITNNDQLNRQLKKNKVSVIKSPYVVDLVGNWKGLIKALFYTPLLANFYWKQISSLKEKPDYILMTGFNEKIIATPIAKLLGIKVIWIEFGSLEPLFEKFFGLPKFLYKLVKNYPSKIIVPSQNTKEKISYLFPKEEMLLIPCGRNLESPIIKNKKSSEQTLTCVSRLEKGKGQDLLIKAFALLKKKYPQLKLRIVGEGDFLQEIQSLTKRLKVKDVTFTGRVKSSIEELSTATICVFPSVWELEGFGLVCIEAMFLAKAIVAFDRPPTNEILQNKHNALLAKNKSVKDLAQRIEELLVNPPLAQKLAKQAKKDFSKKYQIETVTKEYLKLFKSLN